VPRTSFTSETVTLFPPKDIHWSKTLKASLIPPSALRAIKPSASSSACIPKSSTTTFNLLTMSARLILLKSNLWHLDRMVRGILWGSVVARTKMTCAGGSSSVFSRALKASVVSICTSSIIYILYLPSVGANFTFSLKSLISSIPRFEAASISITSIELPPVTLRQFSQSLQGSTPGPFKQFKAFAITFAVVVFPVPRGPQKRYACAVLLFLSAFCRVRLICSCPTISKKFCGLHSRYRAT